MKSLEKKIMDEGQVYPGNVLKVGNFLNHRIDCDFVMKMGEEIAGIFKNDNITKIVTVEASGIAIALAVGAKMHLPLVYAKKNHASNQSGDTYSSTVFSYTHKTECLISIEKQYLSPDDNILIVDDFLALGNALNGLIDIINQSGACVAGISTAIEKGFQHGGDELRKQGYKVASLAVIDSLDGGKIVFRD